METEAYNKLNANHDKYLSNVEAIKDYDYNRSMRAKQLTTNSFESSPSSTPMSEYNKLLNAFIYVEYNISQIYNFTKYKLTIDVDDMKKKEDPVSKLNVFQCNFNIGAEFFKRMNDRGLNGQFIDLHAELRNFLNEVYIHKACVEEFERLKNLYGNIHDIFIIKRCLSELLKWYFMLSPVKEIDDLRSFISDYIDKHFETIPNATLNDLKLPTNSIRNLFNYSMMITDEEFKEIKLNMPQSFKSFNYLFNSINYIIPYELYSPNNDPNEQWDTFTVELQDTPTTYNINIHPNDVIDEIPKLAGNYEDVPHIISKHPSYTFTKSNNSNMNRAFELLNMKYSNPSATLSDKIYSPVICELLNFAAVMLDHKEISTAIKLTKLISNTYNFNKNVNVGFDIFNVLKRTKQMNKIKPLEESKFDAMYVNPQPWRYRGIFAFFTIIAIIVAVCILIRGYREYKREPTFEPTTQHEAFIIMKMMRGERIDFNK